MITEVDFVNCEKVKIGTWNSDCPHAQQEKEFTYAEGSVAELGNWKIIYNVESGDSIRYGFKYSRPCKHCHTPHIHLKKNAYGDPIDSWRWVCPAVITGFTGEYGSRTTETCMYCVLERLAEHDITGL